MATEGSPSHARTRGRKSARSPPKPDQSRGEKEHDERADGLRSHLPDPPRKDARTELERRTGADRQCDRTRDPRRRQGERIEKSGVPLRDALSADNREPKTDIPRAR